MKIKKLFVLFSFVFISLKASIVLLQLLLKIKKYLAAFKKLPKLSLPGNTILCAMVLIVGNLFCVNNTFATNYKLPAGVYGTQTGSATYGTVSSVTYTISYTVATTAVSAAADQLALAWTSGAPTGVTYALTSATLTLTGGANAAATFLPTTTGTKTITLTITTSTATPASTAGYGFTLTTTDNNGGTSGSSAGLTLVVGTRALTVTANNQTKVYGGAFTFAGTEFTTAGLVGSDAVTSTTITSAGAASAATVAGSPYTITPGAAAGSGLANYAISYVAGTFAVTVKSLTLTTPVASGKVYDGTTTASITGALNGIVAPDAVTLIGAGNFVSANVGTGVAVTPACTLSGANAGNYTLTQPAGLTANITAAALTITANNVSKVYGTPLTGAAGSTAFTSTGLKNGETIGSVTIAYGTGSAAHDPVGTNIGAVTATVATGGTFTAGNYSIIYLPGNIAITPKSLTETGGTASNKVYDGTTTATITGGILTGVVSPDVVSISTTGTFASVNVGSGITVTLALTGANAANYLLTQPGITANITPKALTETGATAANKVYDGTTTATITGGTLIGVVSPDVVSVSTTGTFASANAATGITVTIAITGAGTGNYTITQPGITANITPKALTITGITISNKSYDGTTTASISGTASLSGIIGADVVTLGGTPTAVFASQNVATSISVTITGYAISGASAGNYTITQPSGLTANITTATLNIVATGPSKVNGTAQASLSGAGSVGFFNYYGTVPGETITSVTLTLSNTAAQTAGSSYTVTPSLPVGAGGFNISNYSITYSLYNGIVAGHIYTWTGGASTTAWTTTGNWSSSPTGGTYPGSGGVTYDGVILPSGTTYKPTLTAGVTVNTLTYTGNNTLTIASGVKLISTNSFIVNSAATSANLLFSGASTSTILELSSSVFSNYGGFNISGTGLLQVDATGSYIYNGGTVTANGNCTLYLQGGTNVTHALTNAGVFYAGTANSNCNIEMDDYGSIDNSGSFYLGPTSLMYFYNDNAQYVIINNANGGTFTLQSNANGSATIGEIPQGKNNAFTGTFNVERYFQGSTTISLGRYIERNYRIISSCLNTGTIINGNYVFGLNYIVGSTAGQTTTASSTKNAFITGCTGGSTSSGNPSLYLYNESKTPSNLTFTSGNFLGITNITNSTTGGTITASDGGTYSLPVGTGAFFFFRGAATNWSTRTVYPYIAPDNVTLTSTGNMNVGSYTYKDWYTPGSANLGFTGTGTGTNYSVRGFNMIGNPYPSAIDWCAFYTSGSNGITRSAVSPTIWVFNPRTSQYDTFLATSSSGGTATGNASRYVASGQGFVVQATTSSASLVISEYAKVVLNNNAVVGTGAVPAGAKLIGDSLLMSTHPIQTSVPQSIRLKMVTDSINYDDIYIGFNSSSSTGFNTNEDALFLPGTNAPESLASISSDGVQLSVNNLPLPKLAPQVIKLYVTAKNPGTYTLQRTDLQAIPKIYDIWLLDKFKKDSLDIRANSSYTFDITTDTTSYGNNRFQVVIRQNPAMGIHLLNFTASKVQYGAQAVWMTENEENYTNFTVERSTDGGNTFTILGGYLSSALGTYSFLDKNPANGANLYRLKMEDINGTITYSNVVTLIYGIGQRIVKTGIVIYPNPVKSTLNLTIAQDFNTGSTPSMAYTIQITNVLGVVVTKATTNTQNWQTNVSSLMPGTYVIRVINTSNNTLVGQGTFIKM